MERQLAYMRRVSSHWAGREDKAIEHMTRNSKRVRDLLDRYRPIRDDDRVLEVGSGAMGLVFYFGTKGAVGIDPLAGHYISLFPAWQPLATTIGAPGEDIPFKDGAFDVVLSDNVIDHADNPAKIVAEITRVLKVGGILYLTVHIHHPLYHVASNVYGAMRALGSPWEVGPFADHTVHLTRASAERLFAGLPLQILSMTDNLEETKRRTAETPPRHMGDRLKRVFLKNVTFEVIATRTAGTGRASRASSFG